MQEEKQVSGLAHGRAARLRGRGTTDRPGKGNAMGPDIWRDLPQVFAELDENPDVHAVLLFGQGEHFSFGLDLVAMMSALGPHLLGPQMAAQRTTLLQLIRQLQRAIDSVEQCRKPVVAALHGWCIGAGLDLAAACDLRLCSADAQFSLREVKLAIVADLGSLQRLPPIIGQGATRELAFTGKNISAERAREMGLVSQVLANKDALLEEARATVSRNRQQSPFGGPGHQAGDEPLLCARGRLGAGVRGAVERGFSPVTRPHRGLHRLPRKAFPKVFWPIIGAPKKPLACFGGSA